MERTIRNSAKALIIRDQSLLCIKISDGKESWYILPGGGQEAEELLPETACREVAEELGIEVAVKDLAFVIEGRRAKPFTGSIWCSSATISVSCPTPSCTAIPCKQATTGWISAR